MQLQLATWCKQLWVRATEGGFERFFFQKIIELVMKKTQHELPEQKDPIQAQLAYVLIQCLEF